VGAASSWGFGCVPPASRRSEQGRRLTRAPLLTPATRSDASPPHRAGAASTSAWAAPDSPPGGAGARGSAGSGLRGASPEPSLSPRAAWSPPQPGAADGPVRCVSPASSRPMSSAGARVRGGSVAASAALLQPQRGSSLRASNVALPSDFPELPPAAVRRSSVYRRLSAATNLTFPRESAAPSDPASPGSLDEDAPVPSSSDDDDDAGEAADRPAPLPLPLAAFGPRPLSRDPEMEAKLAASTRAEATLSAHDVALIARMSGPLRRVTLRPATAAPAGAAQNAAQGGAAAFTRFDTSGGRPMAAASQWNWGGGDDAEDESESDEDDVGADATKGGAGPPLELLRFGRSSVGAGTEAVRPAVRLPTKNNTFPRPSSGARGDDQDAAAAPPSAEPEPTQSPRVAPRRNGSGSGSSGGLARAGERIARNAAAAAAATLPPAEQARLPAWPPPLPRPSPAAAAVPARPFTAAVHGPRSRAAAAPAGGAAGGPPSPASAELESFLARQEMYNKMYRDKAAKLRAAEAQAGHHAAGRPALNAHSRRLLEAHPAPSLVDRLGSPPAAQGSSRYS